MTPNDVIKHIDTAIRQLTEAKGKCVKGDVHGAQARIVFAQSSLCDALGVSIDIPKTESGYVR